MDKMNTIKKTVATLLLLFVMLPLSAQEEPDTVYTFRFVPEDDMFYVPWGGNDKELARLESCVAQLKELILSGKMPLLVDGYSSAGKSAAENLAMAKIRSNRVKSELIIRQQLVEECFVTKNHSGSGDYVTVRIAVPVDKAEEERLATERSRQQHKAAEESERQKQKQEQIAREQNKAEETRHAAEQAKAERTDRQQAEQQNTLTGTPSETKTPTDYQLSLRANLLRWATLTPDLGIEWRISPSWGIAVNGSWTSWSWSDKDRRYALWEVAPEVRYYMGEKKAWYVGAMFKAGQFNYKLSGTGKQGDLIGGGITGGYQLRLNKALNLDFNLGLGYLNADFEKYEVIDGVRVRRGNETKDWWGPINAGVTLVWKLF